MDPASIVKQQAKSTKGSWQIPERSIGLPKAKTLKKKSFNICGKMQNIQRLHRHFMELAATSAVPNDY